MTGNPKITPGNIETVRMMIERVRNDFNEMDGVRSDIKDRILKDLGSGIGALLTLPSMYNAGQGYSDTNPPYSNRRYNESGLQNIIHGELHAFNQSGNSYITRVSECLVKTMGLFEVLAQKDPPQQCFLRGQPEVNWLVSASIGRKIPKGSVFPTDRVSDFELDALARFQTRVESDDELRAHLFPSGIVWEPTDARWWALKQHYDDDKETGGTRLIDVTTSPLCGLYFACIDWDGTIDSEKDGALWVFTKPVGRRFFDLRSDQRIPGFDDDFDEVAGNDIHTYFQLDRHPEVLRTVLGFDHNERSLSQDGLFLFNNSPQEPINNWWGEAPICFVIPGNFKRDIARELFRIGYTPRKIVRGPKCEVAQVNLEREIR